ncbi:MAG: hypothetical protein J7647_15180 [Cyanobacteria bacterium SBLK]|nr:hypothetical protein [Cyanobacteria bacterium SBLK]
MLKSSLTPTEWCNAKPLLLLSALFIAPDAHAGDRVSAVVPPAEYIASSQPALQIAEGSPEALSPDVPADPLNSNYPVPWNWVMATYADLKENPHSEPRYYRSPALISPDGLYAAYSRIAMQVEEQLFGSRVSSVMFLENLQTGELQTITASSPLAGETLDEGGQYQPGAISMLIPVSWSKEGERLLARQFEGLFSASDASDFAVVWNRNTRVTSTLAPVRVQYTNAVLLGWSTLYPQQVLFRAGSLGEDNWPLWAVDTYSETTLANDDKPIVYGRFQQPAWTGPQAKW